MLFSFKSCPDPVCFLRSYHAEIHFDALPVFDVCLLGDVIFNTEILEVGLIRHVQQLYTLAYKKQHFPSSTCLIASACCKLSPQARHRLTT